MVDGYLNKCKECAKSDARKNRSENIEYYKEYDAWRFQNDPRVKERHKRYGKTIAYKESMAKSTKKWVRNNPEKRAAHIILGNAVKYGKVIKPSNCEKCGSQVKSKNLHAHHHDYTKPIDVNWLCVQCHVNEHKDGENNA